MSWAIIGTGSSGALIGKTFGLLIDPGDLSWRVTGVNAGAFFITKQGYFLGVPSEGTRLLNAAGSEVAFLTDLTVDSAAADTGFGHIAETNSAFNWVLESI